MQQNINVQATNQIEFLQKVQEVIIRGARYKEGTYVSLKTLPMMAEFTVDVGEDPNAEWKDKGPHIWAVPLPMKHMKYSKEQLEAMPIEEIRPILASRNIKGRDKRLMVKEYLESFETEE